MCSIHHQVPTEGDGESEPDLPLLDADGFGYYELHDALSASLLAEGLEAPPPLPARIPSLHDVLTAPSTQAAAPKSSCPALQSTPSSLASASAPSLPMSMLVSKMSKPPRITSQLDPMWEKDLRQHAQDDIESKRVAERRKDMERKSKQQFVLNFFDAVSAIESVGQNEKLTWHFFKGQYSRHTSMGLQLQIFSILSAF